MGMTTVVPFMDPTRPAKADPALLVKTINQYEVTNIFGSPALLNVLGRYTESEGIRLPSVKRVISAGAAMPVATVRRLQKTLPPHAEVYTPYGATECLPVASVSGTQLNSEVEQRTASGEGTCVGQVVFPNKIKIIAVTDGIIKSFDDAVELPVGISGEIVVLGPTSTDRYWQREEQTELAKITDQHGKIWHRMGDAGYFDTEGRLWYCGRKSQRVVNQQETLYPDQVEAIFNVHPEVARTALVGIGPPGQQTPVLCVEVLPDTDWHRQEPIRYDLLQLAQHHALTRSIRRILFHKAFPVDIRHNAKIGREKLALWAAEKLR
jgi:acyl-CoA synthetase (AMP-forming)/AMP-acid ligase II